MDAGSSRAFSGEGEKLPPPPPVPPNTVPLRVPGESSRPGVVARTPIDRPGLGSKGQRIKLLTNHFKVSVGKLDSYFYQYTVSMFYEDGNPMDAKGAGRKVIDILEKTYNHVLGDKYFAYDGDKTLFTIGSLPQNKHEFIIVLDDVSPVRISGSGSPESSSSGKRLKKLYQSKTIKVVISFATRIPLQSIAAALRGHQSDQFQEAVRVLDVILRQNAAKNNCLLVRQSFFQDIPRQMVDLGGGVLGCRGIHASFRPTQAGLSLNMDVSTTIIVKPGPVLEFLKLNQDVRDAHQIDWNKAKRTLKNLRIKMSPSNRESKITGLSEQSCRNQTFMMKQRDKGGEIEVTVYEYFVKHRDIKLQSSADFPCINVGKPKRPTYVPIELCSLVSLQRYTKALTVFQRASLVEKSRQKPRERMGVLMDALSSSKYNDDRILRSSGISIGSQFIQIDGRVLPAPKLLVGNGENFYPQRGRWNFNNKKLLQPVSIKSWAIVNFSARCDINYLISTLTKCANMKGIRVSPDRPPVFEENQRFRRESPQVRVNEMIKLMSSRLTDPPEFILCILPERKNCDIYGPWKKRTLSDIGVISQCIAPVKLNDQYITNVLLKINAKLGGVNSLLSSESTRLLPAFSSRPTIILGMDVSHGSPGRSDIPSVAAVVGSVMWPRASRYKALVRTQSPKVEMISCLFQPEVEGGVTVDNGVIRQLLNVFRDSSNLVKPDQIIIFRDGVSESQFNQVLNIELDQIIKACEFLDPTWLPKFTVIVAQKNHHTKFFQTNSPDNVPPGTVIDSAVCHPKNNDFYLCAHAGMIGTTRPTHYHVLHDEIGFSADDVQELVHSLSYVYQRSTTAISVVAPICYAHLAAAQVSQFVKFEEHYSESGSSQGGITSSGTVAVPQLPSLNKKVWNSMFFC